MKTLWRMVSIVQHYHACFLQCPGGAFTPNMRTTKEFPDDVVTFIRNHPLMFNPIYPIHKRPLIIRIGADYKYTKIAVDRVNAADGKYHVLFLGTGKTNLATAIFLHYDLQSNSICSIYSFKKGLFKCICSLWTWIEIRKLDSLYFLFIFMFTIEVNCMEEIQCLDMNFIWDKNQH